MRFGVKEREVITGAAAAVTGFVVIKQGVLGKLPAFGPISQPLAAILVGFVLAGMIDGGGTTGDVIEGIGYGFIVAGAAAL